MSRNTVTNDLRGMDKVGRELNAGPSVPGPIRDMLQKWLARYLAFVQQRFEKFSRGGGDWAPLAESTLKKRRRGAGRRNLTSTAILVNTGLMRSSLDLQLIRSPESIFKTSSGPIAASVVPEELAIEVRFGGATRYPGSGVSLADVARFQHEGTRYIPPREIIVEPDAQTVAGMRKDADVMLSEMAKLIDGRS